jgi:hypothetical protein
MSKFRKKPPVIEATRWFKNGDHPLDYAEAITGYEGGELRDFPAAYAREHGWEGQIVRYFRRPDIDGESACRECGAIFNAHGWIDKGGSGLIVCPGDWVITSQGIIYPAKPAIFAETYEPVATCIVEGCSETRVHIHPTASEVLA